MNKLLVIAILVLTFSRNLCAQKVFFKREQSANLTDNSSVPKDSITVLMYEAAGLASKILENALVADSKDSYLYKPIGWTNDFERILSVEQTVYFDSMIGKFEKETSAEIAIVTIDSSFAVHKDFDSLVTSIGNTWGVGKRDKNNGVVIGICSRLRKMRISTSAGTEEKLTDAEAKRIIDNEFIPEFRKANYFNGLKKGLLAIMKELGPPAPGSVDVKF